MSKLSIGLPSNWQAVSSRSKGFRHCRPGHVVGGQPACRLSFSATLRPPQQSRATSRTRRSFPGPAVRSRMGRTSTCASVCAGPSDAGSAHLKGSMPGLPVAGGRFLSVSSTRRAWRGLHGGQHRRLATRASLPQSDFGPWLLSPEARLEGFGRSGSLRSSGRVCGPATPCFSGFSDRIDHAQT